MVTGEGRRVVAVAEDEPDLREAVVTVLERAGFEAIAAGSGPELRARLAGRHLDVAILDIAMPGESGLSLARWLRGQGPVGLILATAFGATHHRVEGLDGGADDYVPKPYDLRELVARVRRVLDRREGAIIADAATAALPVAAFRLDPERRTMTDRDGASVALTEGEFALLVALARRRGRPATRGDLAAALGLEGDERAVDVRVARLRRKFAVLNGGGDLLRTVRGSGYAADALGPGAT